MSIELGALRATVDAALEQRMQTIVSRLETYDGSLNRLGNALRLFAIGGKRVRPLGLLLGHRAGGAIDDDAALGPALALELLHTCALLHDDVIDRASTRRGQPTVHHAFAETHRQAGWHGDAAAYGEAVAILLGDLAFVYADELFFEATTQPASTLAAFHRFTAMREEVMAGQYLDLHAALTGMSDRHTAERIATLKSGRYSVSRPLQIGAVLAGSDEPLVSGLRAFGDPVGRAFQVRDDLLGMFGNEQATGKSASSDLAEGKRTLLIAYALERLAPADQAQLEAILNAGVVTDADARVARQLIDSSGARQAAEQYISDELSRADAALNQLAIPPDVTAALQAFSQAVAVRAA